MKWSENVWCLTVISHSAYIYCTYYYYTYLPVRTLHCGGQRWCVRLDSLLQSWGLCVGRVRTATAPPAHSGTCTSIHTYTHIIGEYTYIHTHGEKKFNLNLTDVIAHIWHNYTQKQIVHTHIHCTYVHMCMYKYLHIHVHVHNIHTCAHTQLHKCHTHTYMYVHIHKCPHTYIRMYIYALCDTHVRIYTNVHTYMYVHVYTRDRK